MKPIQYFFLAALALSQASCLAPLAWYDSQLPKLPLGSEPAPPLQEQVPIIHYTATRLEGTLEGDYQNLWMGDQNYFLVLSDADSVEVNAMGAQIVPVGKQKGRYQITAKTPGHLVEISLRHANGKDVRAYSYPVLPFPQPRAIFDKAGESDFVKKADLLRSEGIRLNNTLKMNGLCACQSYSLSYYPQKGKAQTLSYASDAFSKEIKSWFQAAKAGDMFVLHNIMAICPGDIQPRSIESRAFWLSE
jgi:hypothetical protein